MSEHGATLQIYNQELVKCLEDLKLRRKELQAVMQQQQQDKDVLEGQIRGLQDELQTLNNNLSHSQRLQASYDKIINETENGYRKILETSQTLLNAVQLETTKLQKKKRSGLE